MPVGQCAEERQKGGQSNSHKDFEDFGGETNRRNWKKWNNKSKQRGGKLYVGGAHKDILSRKLMEYFVWSFVQPGQFVKSPCILL